MRFVRKLRPAVLVGLILAPGCGGSPTSPSSTPTPTATAPSGVDFTVSPGGEALNSTTVMHYTAQANGTNLTYSWQFPDDGSTATGPTADHLFKKDGNWNVVLTVTNSAGTAAVGHGTMVRDLTGFWADPVLNNGFSWTIAQNGRIITGTDTSLRPSAHLIKGTLADPRAIQFEEGGSDGFLFTGTVEKGLDGIDLSYDSPDGPINIRIVRQ